MSDDEESFEIQGKNTNPGMLEDSPSPTTVTSKGTTVPINYIQGDTESSSSDEEMPVGEKQIEIHNFHEPYDERDENWHNDPNFPNLKRYPKNMHPAIIHYYRFIRDKDRNKNTHMNRKQVYFYLDLKFCPTQVHINFLQALFKDPNAKLTDNDYMSLPAYYYQKFHQNQSDGDKDFILPTWTEKNEGYYSKVHFQIINSCPLDIPVVPMPIPPHLIAPKLVKRKTLALAKQPPKTELPPPSPIKGPTAIKAATPDDDPDWQYVDDTTSNFNALLAWLRKLHGQKHIDVLKKIYSDKIKLRYPHLQVHSLGTIKGHKNLILAPKHLKLKRRLKFKYPEPTARMETKVITPPPSSSTSSGNNSSDDELPPPNPPNINLPNTNQLFNPPPPNPIPPPPIVNNNPVVQIVNANQLHVWRTTNIGWSIYPQDNHTHLYDYDEACMTYTNICNHNIGQCYCTAVQEVHIDVWDATPTLVNKLITIYHVPVCVHVPDHGFAAIKKIANDYNYHRDLEYIYYTRTDCPVKKFSSENYDWLLRGSMPCATYSNWIINKLKINSFLPHNILVTGARNPLGFYRVRRYKATWRQVVTRQPTLTEIMDMSTNTTAPVVIKFGKEQDHANVVRHEKYEVPKALFSGFLGMILSQTQYGIVTMNNVLIIPSNVVSKVATDMAAVDRNAVTWRLAITKATTRLGQSNLTYENIDEVCLYVAYLAFIKNWQLYRDIGAGLNYHSSAIQNINLSLAGEIKHVETNIFTLRFWQQMFRKIPATFQTLTNRGSLLTGFLALYDKFYLLNKKTVTIKNYIDPATVPTKQDIILTTPTKAVCTGYLGDTTNLHPTAKIRNVDLTKCGADKLGTTLVGIGLSHTIPTTHKICAHNELHAMEQRHLVNRTYNDQSFDHYKSWVTHRSFWRINKEFSSTPWEEWVKRFPTPKMNAFNKIKEDINNKQPYNIYRASFFPKVEKTMNCTVSGLDMEKPCRGIQGSSEVLQCLTGPWVHAYSKQMARLWSQKNQTGESRYYYASGYNARTLGKLIEHEKSRFTTPTYLEIDCKFFDAKVHKRYLRLGHYMYRKNGCPYTVYVHIRKDVHVTGRSTTGIVYSIEAGRKSGVNDTSVGNTQLNVTTIAYVLEVLQIYKYSIIALGDDSLVLLEQFINATQVTVMFESLGHEPKIYQSRSLNMVEFCSGRFYPTEIGLVWGPKIGRALGKMGWTHTAIGVDARMWLSGNLKAYINDYHHIPILRAMAARMIQLLPPAERPIMRPDHKYHSDKAYEIHPYMSMFLVNELYGFTWEDVEQLEKKIMGVQQLQTLIYDPRFEVITEIDCPDKLLGQTRSDPMLAQLVQQGALYNFSSWRVKLDLMWRVTKYSATLWFTAIKRILGITSYSTKIVTVRAIATSKPIINLGLRMSKLIITKTLKLATKLPLHFVTDFTSFFLRNMKYGALLHFTLWKHAYHMLAHLYANAPHIAVAVWAGLLPTTLVNLAFDEFVLYLIRSCFQKFGYNINRAIGYSVLWAAEILQRAIYFSAYMPRRLIISHLIRMLPFRLTGIFIEVTLGAPPAILFHFMNNLLADISLMDTNTVPQYPPDPPINSSSGFYIYDPNKPELFLE